VLKLEVIGLGSRTVRVRIVIRGRHGRTRPTARTLRACP
jgi:hypothetical protein